uniref:Uncharacterized protein n=1 Tax=Panagrolaimus sp. PS1159 TaxID=55785 RepID=A0AC35FJD8_9BILA
MSTKNDKYSFFEQNFTTTKNQNNNLNLNQSNKCPILVTEQSYSKPNTGKYCVSDNYKENEKLQLWYESLNTSSFKTVDADNDDLKNAYIFKTMNKSTLSLHAAVYENLTESVASGSLVDENIKGLKKQKFWLIEKQCFSNTLKSRNPFEFLRQQNEDQRNKPEVMQFKASQQLLGSSRPSSAVNFF